MLFCVPFLFSLVVVGWVGGWFFNVLFFFFPTSVESCMHAVQNFSDFHTSFSTLNKVNPSETP